MDGDEHQDIEGGHLVPRPDYEPVANPYERHPGYTPAARQPAGVLHPKHHGAVPGRWINTYPAPHECVAPPIEPGSVVTCGSCRTQRQRQASGHVAIYPYGATPGWVTGAEPDRPEVIRLRRANEELGRRNAEMRRLLGEYLEAREMGGITVLPDDPPAALEAGPAEGSPEWWAAAGRDDLEPGWWGQPDVADPPRGCGCTQCRLTWPAPDASGLCRYCRLLRQQAGRIQVIPLAPRVQTRTAPRPSARPRTFRPHPPPILTLALSAAVLLAEPGTALWFFFMGLLLALLSYRVWRK